MTVTVRFVSRRDASAPLLVMFHDDGSNEREALAVGRMVCPGAPMASMRGHFAEPPGWRHLVEPVRDVAVLESEASAVDRMADAVAAAARREPQLVEVIGVGIGGGADAVLALLCRYPALFAGAMLCRPQRRWSLDSLGKIEHGNGVDVLILTEQNDHRAVISAKLMLALAGHHAEISVVSRVEEVELCRSWLRRELQ